MIATNAPSALTSSTTPRCKFDNLPAELLLLACAHLDRPDLKNARLVCKELKAAAEPPLFATVYLRVHAESFERLEMIANDGRFAPLVRSLEYKVSWWAMFDLSNWEYWCLVLKMATLTGLDLKERDDRICRFLSNEDLKSFHENYLTLVAAQDVVLSDEYEFKKLEEILAVLPHIASLKVTETMDEGSPAKSTSLTFLPQLVSCKNMEFTSSAIRYRSGGAVFRKCFNPSRSRTLLRAAYASKRLKQIKHIEGDSLFGTTLADEDGEGEDDFLSPIYINLPVLNHIDLSIYWHKEIPRDDCFMEMANVVVSLHNATDLKSMHLRFTIGDSSENYRNDKPALYDIIKPKYCWRQLSTLGLSNFIFTLAEISDFLAAHSKSLRVLVVEDIAFQTTHMRVNIADHNPARDPFLDFLHFLHKEMRLSSVMILGGASYDLHRWVSMYDTRMAADCLASRIQRYASRSGPFPPEFESLDNTAEGPNLPISEQHWDGSFSFFPLYYPD